MEKSFPAQLSGLLYSHGELGLAKCGKVGKVFLTGQRGGDHIVPFTADDGVYKWQHVFCPVK